MGKHFNNRAVSAVIATLLLIAIAVAAAIVVYVFSMGLLGGLQTSGGEQVKQQVIMEAYSWDLTKAGLTLTLRNVGPATVQFSDWFISGASITPSNAGAGCMATGGLIVGSNCQVVFGTAIAPTYSAGVAYVIKAVTVDGAVFSFSAVAGESS
jgi:flagellin-like protein